VTYIVLCLTRSLVYDVFPSRSWDVVFVNSMCCSKTQTGPLPSRNPQKISHLCTAGAVFNHILPFMDSSTIGLTIKTTQPMESMESIQVISPTHLVGFNWIVIFYIPKKDMDKLCILMYHYLVGLYIILSYFISVSATCDISKLVQTHFSDTHAPWL